MAQQVISMSHKDVAKLEIMSLLKEKRVPQEEAAKRLKISVRQVRRIYKRYVQHGTTGILSGKRGHASNNKLSTEIKIKAIELIKSKYVDFGPTLAMEKLTEIDS